MSATWRCLWELLELIMIVSDRGHQSRILCAHAKHPSHPLQLPNPFLSDVDSGHLRNMSLMMGVEDQQRTINSIIFLSRTHLNLTIKSLTAPTKTQPKRNGSPINAQSSNRPARPGWMENLD
jgi:hypothetical protein